MNRLTAVSQKLDPPPSHPSRLNIPRSDAIPIKRSGADIIGGKRRRKLC